LKKNDDFTSRLLIEADASSATWSSDEASICRPELSLFNQEILQKKANGELASYFGTISVPPCRTFQGMV
jgi:hypothetical protein